MSERTYLKLHQIIPDPFQPRRNCGGDESLKELAATIQQQGVMQEIVVEGPTSEGKYKVVFGERRYHAAVIAGLEEIPVRIVKNLSEADRLEMQIFENIMRKGLDIKDRANAISRYVSLFPDHKSAAGKLGLSEARLSELLELADLVPEVSQLAEQRLIRDSSTLVMMNQLIKKSPNEAMVLVEKIKADGKISRKVVSDALAPHRKKHKQGATPKAATTNNEPPPQAGANIAPPPNGSDSSGISASTQPEPSHQTSPQTQNVLPGFEEVPVEKINKVKRHLKVPSNVSSKMLISQLIDAYLKLLDETSVPA